MCVVFKIVFLFFRESIESMKRLKNLLTDSAKARRQRRSSLNIQITILAWLTEFFGFATIFLGSFVLGHDDNMVTLSLQTLSLIFYFVLTPSTLLLNSTKLKSTVIDSEWYMKFHKIFYRQFTHDIKESCKNKNLPVDIELKGNNVCQGHPD